MSIRDGLLKADGPWGLSLGQGRLHNGPFCQTCMVAYTGYHRCTGSQLRARAATLRRMADQLEAQASEEDSKVKTAET